MPTILIDQKSRDDGFGSSVTGEIFDEPLDDSSLMNWIVYVLGESRSSIRKSSRANQETGDELDEPL